MLTARFIINCVYFLSGSLSLRKHFKIICSCDYQHFYQYLAGDMKRPVPVMESFEDQCLFGLDVKEISVFCNCRLGLELGQVVHFSGCCCIPLYPENIHHRCKNICKYSKCFLKIPHDATNLKLLRSRDVILSSQIQYAARV